MKIKNSHIIFFLLGLLFLLKFNTIISSYYLLYLFIGSLFSEFNNTISNIDLMLLDVFLSAILFIVAPLLTYRYRKYKLLVKELNFISVIAIILLTIFLFAPVIANFHPDFHKNINVTKLLKPFSSKVLIEQRIQGASESVFDKFISLRNSTINQPFYSNKFFVDNVSSDNKSFQQKDTEELLPPGSNSKRIYFVFGTDELGRDVFSRIVYGARVSLSIGIVASLISMLLGVFFGFYSGYKGGAPDFILNKFSDLFLAFPIIFLIIFIISLWGSSFFILVLILGITSWMPLYKLVRTDVFSIRNKDYYKSAVLLGLNKKQLLLKEILPAIIPIVVVNIVYQFANVVLAESALSYLGLGTGSNLPSWGKMINEGQSYLYKGWWLIFFPGMFLLLTLSFINILGKRISESLNPLSKND
ncbi:MAG TPA: ABC transporter permease [Ignavibacteriaceae bacterium]|nr:ABC transporter permease [Ignavibacteriaceae bacterium]